MTFCYNVLTSKAFKLLRPEDGCTPGLFEAKAYITLDMKSAVNRFKELLR
jgi:hypothetical protein